MNAVFGNILISESLRFKASVLCEASDGCSRRVIVFCKQSLPSVTDA